MRRWTGQGAPEEPRRYVVIDRDGSDQSHVGLVVRYAAGVSYRQQCGGVECDQRSVEGCYVLAAGTEVQGSAGYVAIERVAGALHGHSGTFALQHSGTMTRGAPQLIITVVPDSGTGQLVGLNGSMTINMVEGTHLYDFEYALAKPL